MSPTLTFLPLNVVSEEAGTVVELLVVEGFVVDVVVAFVVDVVVAFVVDVVVLVVVAGTTSVASFQVNGVSITPFVA